jgi:hypothetical protein
MRPTTAFLPFIQDYNKDYNEAVEPLDHAPRPSARPQTMFLRSTI